MIRLCLEIRNCQVLLPIACKSGKQILAQLPIAWNSGLLVARPFAWTCLDLPSSAAKILKIRIAGCQPSCLDLPRFA